MMAYSSNSEQLWCYFFAWRSMEKPTRVDPVRQFPIDP